MTIQISGYDVQIDEEDYDKVSQYKWSVNMHVVKEKGLYPIHATIYKPKKQTVRLARIIMGLSIGDRMVVDHINGDTLDNRKQNLRVCTNTENSRNSKTPKCNTSGYKGVSFTKDRDVWSAYIGVDRKRIHLGQFSTAVDAAKVYDCAALYFFKEYARTNFHRDTYTIHDINKTPDIIKSIKRPAKASVYKGVHKCRNYWVATVSINGSRVYVGSYPTDAEAAMAYDKKATELLGDKAKLNFPENKGAT